MTDKDETNSTIKLMVIEEEWPKRERSINNNNKEGQSTNGASPPSRDHFTKGNFQTVWTTETSFIQSASSVNNDKRNLFLEQVTQNYPLPLTYSEAVKGATLLPINEAQDSSQTRASALIQNLKRSTMITNESNTEPDTDMTRPINEEQFNSTLFSSHERANISSPMRNTRPRHS